MLVAMADTVGLVLMTTLEPASKFMRSLAFSTAVGFNGVHTAAALQFMFLVGLVDTVTAALAVFPMHSKATQRSPLRPVAPRIGFSVLWWFMPFAP